MLQNSLCKRRFLRLPCLQPYHFLLPRPRRSLKILTGAMIAISEASI
ncbi:hypothetical protein C100_10090 [Sphingobium sp. C100]|nr:hypothetical protein C100_10090 [Sphingobium sp. C100]